jgi:hypothetical protein
MDKWIDLRFGWLPRDTQFFGLDYYNTFSPMAKITSVHLFISMALMCHWPLYWLDIKNAFLHGDLHEKVYMYMEQLLSFIASEVWIGMLIIAVSMVSKNLLGLSLDTVIQQFGMQRSESDHSVFYHHTFGRCIYLVVYVDDIAIRVDDSNATA